MPVAACVGSGAQFPCPDKLSCSFPVKCTLKTPNEQNRISSSFLDWYKVYLDNDLSLPSPILPSNKIPIFALAHGSRLKTWSRGGRRTRRGLLLLLSFFLFYSFPVFTLLPFFRSVNFIPSFLSTDLVLCLVTAPQSLSNAATII